MKQVISGNRIPIKAWLDDIEEGALEQATHLANLPFAFKHIALLPDCHQGYGMPIGGVLATHNVVVPNAVGVDIGCGMIAVQTGMKANDITTDQLKEIMGRVRRAIPVGFSRHSERQDESLMPKRSNGEYWGWTVASNEFESALRQLGTLGGGNHFIEIQRDDCGYVWVMIHSGSRNLGKKVADHYNSIAKKLNEQYLSCVPREWDLAFLPLDHLQGENYMEEMQYCVDFALANRSLMMDRVVEIFKGVTGCSDIGNPINIAHNYAAIENHFGKNVVVHRKGATLAREDTIGIIPGSQGSKSYIVRGKGNRESFTSCSHGAGRAMGRKAARRTLSLKDELARMDEQGIIHGMRSKKDLDEAAGAYKDVGTVMKNQEDLVDIVAELSPLAVIKG